MPTYRKLHTKIIDSYDFAEMPDDFTRVFWMLLIVTVDSEGRAIDNPSWLRSKMFPMRSDVSNLQIETALSWLDQRQMLTRYCVNGRGYFYIPKFKNYQSGTEREAKSVLPSPDELVSKSGVIQEEVATCSTASASASVYESEDDSVFVLTRQIIEKETGVMATPNDIKAIDEIVGIGAIEADILAGIHWLKGQGKTIRYYTSIVGPTRTAMQHRIQSGNGHTPEVPHEKKKVKIDFGDGFVEEREV